MSLKSKPQHLIDAPLDPEIEPLIHSMNQHDWLTTVSSCFGHDSDPIHDTWYIAFWCRKSAIDRLVAILEDAEQHDKFLGDVSLEVVWSSEIANCQTDAEPDWLSLHLTVSSMSYEERQCLTNEYTAAFDRIYV